MKKNTALNKTLLGMNSLIFSVLIPFAALCCFITAFEFHIAGDLYEEILPVDLRGLLYFCLVVGILCTFCNLCKLSATVPLLFVGYALFLWWQKDLWLSLRALVFVTARRFNRAYNSGIPYWCIVTETEIDLQAIFSLLASLYVAVVAWAVCHKQSAFWILSLGLLYFIPCTVMTNTVPNTDFLILLAVTVFLYLLTQWNRTHASPHGLGLTLLLIIPVTLFMIHIFSVQPMEEYKGAERAQTILHKLQDRFNGSTVATGQGTGSTKSNIVELGKVGNMTQRKTPVMYLESPYSGTYYLRGKAFDIYTGTQWQCIDPNSEGGVRELPRELITDPDTIILNPINIRTRYTEKVFYFPFFRAAHQWNTVYYTKDHLSFYGNHENLQEYSYDFSQNDALDLSTALTDTQRSTYTQLPDSTRLWATELLSRLSNKANPRNILEFLNAYGYYDLNTDRMPTGTEDFAKWFLESSETGYCVHYATAATVLLRCAGVPARYVTGYMVEVKGREVTTVYEKDAHAWVEYWNSASRSWEIMEATPSSSGQAESTTTTTETAPTTTKESTAETTSATTNTTAPTKPEANTQRPTVKDPASSSSQKKFNFQKLLKGIATFLLYVLPILALWLQWKLRVELRRRSRHKGTSNDRAIRCWREVTLYSCRLGKKPPRPLLTIAERAKFSPHKIRNEELAQYYDYFDKAVKELRQKVWYRRLADRLIFALY